MAEPVVVGIEMMEDHVRLEIKLPNDFFNDPSNMQGLGEAIHARVRGMLDAPADDAPAVVPDKPTLH